MTGDYIVVSLIIIISVFLSIIVGGFMSKVYKGQKNILDILTPVENIIFKLCRINPLAEMNWKQYLTALFCINLVWLIWGIFILLFQGKLFLNPAGNPSMEWSLAFNSAISFLTSTNLQHYSGETGATYLSQIAVFMFLQFVSAATSLCAGVAVVRGFIANSCNNIGNFYNDFVKSITRILLPLCVIVAILFLFNGMPMTFNGPQKIMSLQGDSITVATGPIAAFEPIKELGSNGGGFFGTNDAHPFENPNFYTFIIHSITVFLLPMAFIFMIGFYLQRMKFSVMLFLVMLTGFLLIVIPIINQEVHGNSALHSMGINISAGNMEGKEVRFGSFYSAFYAGENVIIPAGTMVGMHDSFMPLSGLGMLIAMHIDSFFGGVGTGWINMFIFLIIAVLIATLMIGRTAEILNKKIGLPEVQIAVGILVAQIIVPFGLAAIACFVYVNYPGGNNALGWLSNKGPHGFTTMLYEFISSVAGNGSEFSGLGNNTLFWNLTTSFAMLMGRFIPITGAIIIAGRLRAKKFIPTSSGSLPIDSGTFAIFLFFMIMILSVLSAFPALILGPISEHLLK